MTTDAAEAVVATTEDPTPSSAQPVDTSTTAEERNRVESGSDIETNRSQGKPVLMSSEPVEEFKFPEKFLNDKGEPDAEALGKSYVELEKKLRETRPAAPDSADAYEYDWGDFPINDEKTAAFKEQAHKMGLSTQQYAGLMDMYVNEIASLQPSAEAAEAQLKEVWGNDMDANLANANKAWQTFGPDFDIDPVIGNHPAVLQVLARIGAEIVEDDASEQRASNAQPTMTTDEIKEAMSRPDYWTNRELQAKVAAAYEQRRK